MDAQRMMAKALILPPSELAAPLEQLVARARGYAREPKLCAVRALDAWLAAAAITTGPLFRGVDQLGRVSDWRSVTGPSPMSRSAPQRAQRPTPRA
jgi:hypothetical protein